MCMTHAGGGGIFLELIIPNLKLSIYNYVFPLYARERLFIGEIMTKCKKCGGSERCHLIDKWLSLEGNTIDIDQLHFRVIGCKVRKGKLQLVVE